MACTSVKPLTWTGRDRLTVLSSPNWPLPLSPQAQTVPSMLRASSSPEITHEGIFIRAGTTLRDAEKALILQAYEKTGRNKTKTAELLQTSLTNIRNKLKEYAEEDED